MKIFAVIDEDKAPVLAMLTREMLLRAAKNKGLTLEAQLSRPGAPLTARPAPGPGDIVLLVPGQAGGPEAVSRPAWAEGLPGTFIVAAREDILNESAAFWHRLEQAAAANGAAGPSAGAATGAGEPAAPGSEAAGNAPAPAGTAAAARSVHNIVAVTSCPTGIAHTFMAAEALTAGAKALGLAIRVETQGSVGAGTPLTEAEIAAADLVIIAADRKVERGRFNGKYVYVSGTKAAIANGQAYIQTAIAQAGPQAAGKAAATEAEGAKSGQTAKSGFYAPLMTGVSFMLPFVVAGGLLIALGLALGGVNVEEQNGSFAHILWQIGARGVFPLIVPVLAGYIALAIGDRPALAPGMVGGFVSDQIGAGFLGGIIAGFLAGYITRAAAHYIRLPRAVEGLKPVLVLPLLCTAATGLILFYVIQTPTTALLHFLTDWVRSLEAQSNGAAFNALLLGALIGGMMAVDMGGPVNKAAYTVAIGLLSVKIYTPMAAAMIGGMTPPMALALACYLRPRCFTTKERESKEATFIMGLSFISEGAIPFATRDPLRVIPCLVAGSAVAGAAALLLGTGIIVPHGGIFLLPIKGAILNYSGYFAALIGGTAVSALCLCLICRPLAEAKNRPEEQA